MSAFSFYWLGYGIFSAVFFFGAWVLVNFSIRQKRYHFLAVSLLLLVISYVLIQLVCTWIRPVNCLEQLIALSLRFTELPKVFTASLLIAVCAAEGLLFIDFARYEREHITVMSVKEAADSLPTGICYYTATGRVLMINKAMESFARQAGCPLDAGGRALYTGIATGRLSPGFERHMESGGMLITTPDGRALSVREGEDVFDGGPLYMLSLIDVSAVYGKTLSLRKLHKELSALNERLTGHNRRIVELTAQKELLAARVRLHDEMGADLLSIKNYIHNGGGEEQRRRIETSLIRDLSFLLTGQASAPRDEYELILETAERLGVRVVIEGELPRTEPQKHTTATAIHECLTNTLRHAKGRELIVSAVRRGDRIVISITNDGEQPVGDIKEKGGLASLRALIEMIPGASMEILVSPSFCVRITMPEEVPDAV